MGRGTVAKSLLFFRGVKLNTRFGRELQRRELERAVDKQRKDKGLQSVNKLKHEERRRILKQEEHKLRNALKEENKQKQTNAQGGKEKEEAGGGGGGSKKWLWSQLSSSPISPIKRQRLQQRKELYELRKGYVQELEQLRIKEKKELKEEQELFLKEKEEKRLLREKQKVINLKEHQERINIIKDQKKIEREGRNKNRIKFNQTLTERRKLIIQRLVQERSKYWILSPEALTPSLFEGGNVFTQLNGFHVKQNRRQRGGGQQQEYGGLLDLFTLQGGQGGLNSSSSSSSMDEKKKLSKEEEEEEELMDFKALNNPKTLYRSGV